METDSRFGSRKFIITLVSLGLLVGTAILAGLVPAFVSIFPTLVGGIIGVVSVYMTGNIVNKGVVLNSSGFAIQQKNQQANLLRNKTETVLSKDATGTLVQEEDDAEGKEA